jgi:hypothetical protein
MDFADQIKELSNRARKQVCNLETEEATKTAFVMPFIRTLGYDIFDPEEVIPEFTADHGVKKGEKVDYAIVKEGTPIILFECKAANLNLDHVHLSQLYRYFSVTEARIGILTNGVVYRFYSDLEQTNKMDDRPFLEINLLALQEKLIPELKKISKQDFNQESLTETAEELKYTKEIKKTLSLQLHSPTEEIVKSLARSVYSGKLTKKNTGYFQEVVKKAFKEFVNEQITERLESAISQNETNASQNNQPSKNDGTDADSEVDNKDEIEQEDELVETEEEKEGFRIVRSILREAIDYKRIESKKYKTYFNILLDGNLRKPLCRLRFNSSKKYIELFDRGKNASEKVHIELLDDIYRYADRIKKTPKNYEG